MNLYYLNGATPQPPPTTVTTNPGPDGWVSEGCYSDNVAFRTLAHQVDTPGGGSAMTVALCVDACHAAGYVLAGVEYGSQCCESSRNPTALIVAYSLKSATTPTLMAGPSLTTRIATWLVKVPRSTAAVLAP